MISGSGVLRAGAVRFGYDAAMLNISSLEAGDIAEIAAAFAALGWNKTVAQYKRYLVEQSAGERNCLVARDSGKF